MKRLYQARLVIETLVVGSRSPLRKLSLGASLASAILASCSQSSAKPEEVMTANVSTGSGDTAPKMPATSGMAAPATSTARAGTNAATMPSSAAIVTKSPPVGGESGAAATGMPMTKLPTTQAGAPATAGAAGTASQSTAMTAGAASAAGAGGMTVNAPACEKGKIKGSEVIVMGESFYAINRNILDAIEKNAKAAGALGMSDSYRNYSVSGQLLTGTIPGQFDMAIGAGPVKVVIMDGGGNDCMSSPCDECPPTFEKLLKKMADNQVEIVIYTRYPEPGNPPGSFTTLKNNLDVLMPKMEQVCAKSTMPKCHWVDLRPVWKDGDTQDGLHPTVSGGQHVGDAIWATMVEKCIAQ